MDKMRNKETIEFKDKKDNVSKFQKKFQTHAAILNLHQKFTFSCRVRNKRRAKFINFWNFSGQNQ